MLGMILEDLDVSTYREILVIYDRIIGGDARTGNYLNKGNLPMSVSFVRKTLIEQHIQELRFGSSFAIEPPQEERDAKLIIREDRNVTGDSYIYFRFEPNLVHGPRAEELVGILEREIDYFLFSRELAIFPEYQKRNQLKALTNALEGYDMKWTSGAFAAIFEAKRRLALRCDYILSPDRIRIVRLKLDRLERQLESKFSLIYDANPGHAAIAKNDFIKELAMVYEIMGWNNNDFFAAD